MSRVIVYSKPIWVVTDWETGVEKHEQTLDKSSAYIFCSFLFNVCICFKFTCKAPGMCNSYKKIFYCTTLYDKVDFSIIIQIECPGEQNKQAKTEKLYFYIFFSLKFYQKNKISLSLLYLLLYVIHASMHTKVFIEKAFLPLHAILYKYIMKYFTHPFKF